MKKAINKKVSLILIILVLGLFLRFYNLGHQSFSQDEAYTAVATTKFNTFQIIGNSIERGQIIIDNKYSYVSELPTYYIFLEQWVNVFGISEAALRGFSALFGFLSLILIFYLANYIFNNKIALLSSFLASINLTLLWYSQEARQFSYLLFLTLLSVIFLVKYVNEKKKAQLIGLLVTNILIIYSYLPLILFMFFEGIYILYLNFKIYFQKTKLPLKSLLIAFIFLGLLYIPLVNRIFFSSEDTLHLQGRPDIIEIGKFGVELVSWLYPSELMSNKIYNHSFDFSIYEWGLLISVLLAAILMGILFLYGVYKLRKLSDSYLIVLMFLFPLLFSIILSAIHPRVTIFHMRILLYIVPAYIIIVAVGCLSLKNWKWVVGFIIILNLLPIYAFYTNPTKQQFREASKFLPLEETIFVTKDTAKRGIWYYYGEKPNVIGILDLNELKENVKGKNSFWYVFTFMKYVDQSREITGYLDKNYEVIERKQLFDIELVHYGGKISS